MEISTFDIYPWITMDAIRNFRNVRNMTEQPKAEQPKAEGKCCLRCLNLRSECEHTIMQFMS